MVYTNKFPRCKGTVTTNINLKILGHSDITPLITWEVSNIPANTRRGPNAGLMLGQRRRRWANINPALGPRLVLAGT